MHRRTMAAALAACCLFLLLCAQGFAQEVSLGGQRQKITTASNVRARTAPQTAAEEVTRLKLGTVVIADARSAEQTEAGGRRDYWYRVGLPGGGTGWVFGGLLADYDPAQRQQVVGRIIDERLKLESMSFDDGTDLYEFISAALADARSPKERGALELARLRALGMAVASIPGGQEQQPPYRDFYKAHEREIYHHEFAGGWYVRPEAFWELEAKHRGSEAGDSIAWEAAHAVRQGECEGDDVCNLLALQDTEGRYLGLYPNGAHAAEALQDISQALASDALDATMRRKGGDKYAVEERTALTKALAELHAAVLKTTAAERASILKRLGQLAPRAR